MGAVGDGATWHLVVSNETARNRVLASDHLPLNGRAQKIAKVRVHWLPLYVPDQFVVNFLAPYGDIKEKFLERSIIAGMTNIHTLVRSYIVLLHPGVEKDDLPFTENMKYNDESLKYLVTVQGRQPRCLRCKKVGHVSKPECKSLWCRSCAGSTDHVAADCMLKVSYSNSVISAQLVEEPVDIDMRGEDELPINSRNQSHRSVLPHVFKSLLDPLGCPWLN